MKHWAYGELHERRGKHPVFQGTKCIMKLVRSVFGKRDERLAKQIFTTKPFVRAALYINYMNLRVSTLYRCYNYINHNYFSFKRS